MANKEFDSLKSKKNQAKETIDRISRFTCPNDIFNYFTLVQRVII